MVSAIRSGNLPMTTISVRSIDWVAPELVSHLRAGITRMPSGQRPFPSDREPVASHGMVSLLWFLLPVAAAAGWIAARVSLRQTGDASWNYARNFHRSLGALLKNTHEVPVELFAGHTDTDRDTADTQMAVGNLFRRRGEVNRAIHLHQSLLDRDELEAEVRAAAHLELARDYDSAGLLDRSENAFREVIASGRFMDEAYECLLQLQERESEWAAAIVTARSFARDCRRPLSSLIAHYHCELALEALGAGELSLARQRLGDALASCSDCARANMINADMAIEDRDHALANRCFEAVEKQRPELMPEIVERWFQVLHELDDPVVLRQFVDKVQARRNAYSVIRATRRVIAELDGITEADRFFKRQILLRPSLKALRDWAHDQLEVSKPGEREKVQVICTMLDQVVEEKPAYQCANCGFRGNVLHWRCPGCGTWDSVRTIIGAEGE